MSTYHIIGILVVIIIIAVIIFAMVKRQSAKKGIRKTSTSEAKNNQVYIGNLSYGVSEEDLRQFFQPYGQISEIHVVKNNKTGRSKGFAFVTYRSIAEADASLVTHGKNFQGRRLVVRIAKPRL